MAASDKSLFSPSDGVVCRVLDGDAVVLDSLRGVYFELNEVGARAWSLLVHENNIDSVVRSLPTEFDVDSETMRSDLLNLIADLEEQGLLQPSPKPSVDGE